MVFYGGLELGSQGRDVCRRVSARFDFGVYDAKRVPDPAMISVEGSANGRKGPSPLTEQVAPRVTRKGLGRGLTFGK